jgi:hypothetical protein
VLIMEIDHRVIRIRLLQDEVGEESKFVRARQFRPSLRVGSAQLDYPLMTATRRNRAWDAACVIQPDCPGWPLPHVMKPYRRR